MKSPRLYLRLLRYTLAYRWLFAASLLGTVVVALTEPAIPALIKPLLDGSFVAKDPTYIRWMPVALGALFLVRGAAGFVGTVALKAVAYRVVMDLRREMFDRILKLPCARFDQLPSGQLLSRFSYDVNQVMTAASDALVILVRDSLAVLGLLAWMFYLNWRLSLIILIVVPAIAVVVRLVSRRLRHLSRRLQDAMGDMNHLLDEVIQGQREVKVFGSGEEEGSRFHGVNDRVRYYNLHLAATAAASVPGVQFLAVLALATVIYLASLQALEDKVTVGGFVSLFGAMAMLLAPLKRLTRVNETIQRGLAAAESVFALIDEQAEPDQGCGKLSRSRGHLRLEGVSFRYHDDQPWVLQAIDLEIKPGEVVALVGASGSGKTTLAQLLPRFYSATQGRILLDGVDITSLSLASLRSQLGYVGQQVVLFNDTVAANLAYGSSTPVSRERLTAVAQQAAAGEFIAALSHGLDTQLGTRGSGLSGGQRQRLSLARALLKDAPVLILDEATSALDREAEARIQTTLATLKGHCSQLIIAHRLSTVEQADRIVVLAEGRIVEQGRHQELLAKNGVYAALHRSPLPA